MLIAPSLPIFSSFIFIYSAPLSPISQFPFFVIAIGITLYFSLSKFFITPRAEESETSCSPDFPPKITARFIFFVIKYFITFYNVPSEGIEPPFFPLADGIALSIEHTYRSNVFHQPNPEVRHLIDQL